MILHFLHHETGCIFSVNLQHNLTFIGFEQIDCLFCGDVLSLKSLEGCNADVSDQGVELVHAVFVLVAETSKTNSHTEGNVPTMGEKQNQLVK